MSIASALLALISAPDPLVETLRGLPFNEAEPVPGGDWARLRVALGIDEAAGKLLVSTIRQKKMGSTNVDPSWSRIDRLSREGHDLYFGLSKVRDDWAPHRNGDRGNAKSCLPRRFIGVDFDLEFGVHADGGIALDDAITAIERFPVRPVAVVFSGGGLHAYYRLAGNADAKAVAWAGDRINGFFARATDPDKWDTTPTIDLARILRVPGTLNHKADGVWVRLVHVDEQAEPITRAMAEAWPTFGEVKRRQRPEVSRPRRNVPKILRTYKGSAPWDAFNAAFADSDAFCAFLERLGADVNGTTVRMPGAPEMNDNRQFSASIHSNADETILLLTIHGTTTCTYWANGGTQQHFGAYDLLVRTFDGDRSATARYVKRVVLDDPEGWLADFTWTPGDLAPFVSGSGAQTDRTTGPVSVSPACPAAASISVTSDLSTLHFAPSSSSGLGHVVVTNQDDDPARVLAARPHCQGCCPGLAYPHLKHPKGGIVEHLSVVACEHATHCPEHCHISGCAATHSLDDDCQQHDDDF